MTFKHPLARTSHIGSTDGMNGKIRHILVIITSLQLDKEHDKYNDEAVSRLSNAARSWVKDHSGDAGDFMLMNRPKKWVGDKG